MRFMNSLTKSQRKSKPLMPFPKCKQIIIIGLTRKKGCGKDTVGNYLVENYGFVRIAIGYEGEAHDVFLAWRRAIDAFRAGARP